MRFLRLSVLFLAGLISSLLFTAEKVYAVSASERTINDSLVQNLSCRNLSVESIYRSIRDDAFEAQRNIPMKNWPFRRGATVIAGCWGLSSTQRMISYLARYNTSSNEKMSARVADVLDMVRREKFEVDFNVPGTSGRIKSVAPSYKVFAVEEPNLKEGYFKSLTSLWSSLMLGYMQNLNGTKRLRNFREDIQANQAEHFFRVSNLKMGMGGGARPAETNRLTASWLRRNLDGKRLTLLNLRAARATQHIVMAKSYKLNSNGLMEITVYDSNNPYTDALLYFDSRAGVFYSPQVMGPFLVDDNKGLGVFIVSEEEREPLEAAMLAHYRTLCR